MARKAGVNGLVEPGPRAHIRRMLRKLLAAYATLFVFLAVTAALGRLIGTPLVLLLEALSFTAPRWAVVALGIATYAVAATFGVKAALRVFRWGWGETAAPRA